MKYLLFFGLLLPVSAPAFDEADQAALSEVQALLQDPAALKGPAGNPQEKAALAEIEKISKDPAVRQGIHQVSSDIFTDLAKTHDGNEGGIGAALIEAQRDPAKFMRSLSPEQQKKIRDLASEIDKKNGAPQK